MILLQMPLFGMLQECIPCHPMPEITGFKWNPATMEPEWWTTGLSIKHPATPVLLAEKIVSYGVICYTAF